MLSCLCAPRRPMLGYNLSHAFVSLRLRRPTSTWVFVFFGALTRLGLRCARLPVPLFSSFFLFHLFSPNGSDEGHTMRVKSSARKSTARSLLTCRCTFALSSAFTTLNRARTGSLGFNFSLWSMRERLKFQT